MKRNATTIVPALLLVAVAAGGGIYYFSWSPSPARPALPPREVLPTAGTRSMAARLRALAGAWESAAYHEEEDRTFRANRPRWIDALRARAETSRKLSEVLTIRHLLARELLWAGRTEESLRELNGLRAALEQSTVPADARRELMARLRDDVAIAFLRQGEVENCLDMHGAESCIFPIRAGGVHRRQAGSRMAVEVLSESLRADPGDLGSRWLLNLAYMTLGEYPEGVPGPWRIPPEVFESEYDVGRFRDVASERGLATVGLAGGCCVEDFDGDGDLDVLVSSWGLRDQLRYYEQIDGGAFRERTEEAGLTGELGGLNLCHGDFDNDGAPDVLVLRGGWLGENGDHPNSLLRNRGDGSFDDVTESSGLLAAHPGQTAAWADFDNDGWLDLFVGNEQDAGGRHPSQLFHNHGDGTFADCAAASGVANLGFVKGAAWGDYDNDGWPDLYVSRIDQLNLLFRNRGERARPVPEAGATTERPSFAWKFEDVTARSGVGEPRFSFPVWFFDYDNDGWLDLFAAGFDGAPIDQVAGDYLGRPHRRGHPRLYRNLGDGSFRDVTRQLRLDRVLLVMGANFGDLDGDGFLDLYLGTGAPDLRTLMPNRMFRNDGGRAFQDVTSSGGFGHLQKGHGIAFADIDGDGDQDVFAVMGGWYTSDVYPNALFLNPGHGNHWITLRLRGRRTNRAAIGARIRVRVNTDAGPRDIHATVGTGGSFGSASLQQEIGLGQARSIQYIEIRWPTSGAVQRIDSPDMDRVLEIEESS